MRPDFEGVRSRIELLGDLLICDKLDHVPEIYDEMEHIIKGIERNERLQAGEDGERLLRISKAARSNLNVDLRKLDQELLRQFGLYAVEVIGDGVRFILLSFLFPSSFHLLHL